MTKTILAVLILAGSVSAGPIQVTLDTNATRINFTLSDVIHTVHGSFKLTRGAIWLDPTNGKAGGELVVSATSGNSGSQSRDSRMSRNILQTSDFPEIVFRPDRVDGSFRETGDSAFRLHGVFAIHGARHELVMKVKSRIEAGHVTATADFDIPYVKWGMKDPSTLFLRVGNAVQIEIAAVGKVE